MRTEWCLPTTIYNLIKLDKHRWGSQRPERDASGRGVTGDAGATNGGQDARAYPSGLW